MGIPENAVVGERTFATQRSTVHGAVLVTADFRDRAASLEDDDAARVIAIPRAGRPDGLRLSHAYSSRLYRGANWPDARTKRQLAQGNEATEDDLRHFRPSLALPPRSLQDESWIETFARDFRLALPPPRFHHVQGPFKVKLKSVGAVS